MIDKAVDAGIGLLGIGLNKVGQVNQQKKLQKVQVKGAKEMSEFQKKQDLDMWNKTNYGAQKDHMKEAGLNPALMYGIGGSGGATIGSGGGGMPTGASAEGQSQGTRAMLDIALMGAQKKVLESQAEKNEAEADKAKEDTTGRKIENEVSSATIDDMIEMRVQGARNEREKARAMELGNKFEEWLQQPVEAGQPIKQQQAIVAVQEGVSRMQEIDQWIRESGAKINIMGLQASNIQSDTALKQQLKEQLDRINPIELDRMVNDLENAEKRLQMLKNDPANTQVGQYINFATESIGNTLGIIKGVRGTGSTEVRTDNKGESRTERRNW